MSGIASTATSVLVRQVAAAMAKITLGAGGIMLTNHSPSPDSGADLVLFGVGSHQTVLKGMKTLLAVPGRMSLWLRRPCMIRQRGCAPLRCSPILCKSCRFLATGARVFALSCPNPSALSPA